MRYRQHARFFLFKAFAISLLQSGGIEFMV